MSWWFSSKHSLLLCTLICFIDWIPPLRWKISFGPLLLMAWLILICKDPMQEMWKNQQSWWLEYFSAIRLTFFALLSALRILFRLFDSSLLFNPYYWWLLIREELMQEMWKKSTSAMIRLILTKHNHLLCTLICFIYWIPPLWWLITF